MINATRDIYPHPSKKARKMNKIKICGTKPRTAPTPATTPSKTQAVHEFHDDLENAITEVEDMLSGNITEGAKRFFAVKLLEKDDKIHEQLENVQPVSLYSILQLLQPLLPHL